MKLTYPYPLQRAWAFLAQPRLVVLAQPERLFLGLALPFGALFIILLAPFQAPDEFMHFYRAYSISTGQWTGVQATLPESVLEFSYSISKDIAGNDQNKQSKIALLQELSRPFTQQPQAEVMLVNSAIVSPLPYIPQSFGVLIGRLGNLNPILIFYLGRIANFAAWIGLTLLAIHITPIHKRLFVALALMPMTLHQAASNSPDAVTIAVSFLFVAYVLRIWMDQRLEIQWADWVWISGLVVALAFCKSIYILAAGLLLAVTVRRFRQQPMILPIAAAVIGLGLASGLAWLVYSSQIVSADLMAAYQTPTLSGITYILRHPQAALPLLWREAAGQVGFQLRTFVGVLGWIDTPLPNWVYPLYFTLLLGVVVFETHANSFFVISERLWMAFLALIAGLVLLLIFVYPDESSGEVRFGIAQGRYYIPLASLYLLPFSQSKWSISEESPAWVVVAVLHALVLLVAARALLWRYYAI